MSTPSPASAPAPRGLLLLDVDGPLFPWHNKRWRRPEGFRSYRLTRRGQWFSDRSDIRRYAGRRHRSILVWLNPDHGRQILRLVAHTGLRPVWATTWLDGANTYVGPELGLPELPCIRFPDDDLDPDPDAQTSWRLSGGWKYPAVGAYAGRLPVAWLDDEFDERIATLEVHPGEPRHTLLRNRAAAKARFLDARADSPTLLCQVDPSTGLLDHHLDHVRRWADTLPRP